MNRYRGKEYTIHAELNRRVICHLCLMCGESRHLVHAGAGKYFCKNCLDNGSIKQRRMVEKWFDTAYGKGVSQ